MFCVRIPDLVVSLESFVNLDLSDFGVHFERDANVVSQQQTHTEISKPYIVFIALASIFYCY
jgi:hypothetical protein